MAGGEIYRVEIPIIIDDQTDKPLQQAERKVSRFEKSVQKTNERIRRIFGREIRLKISAVDKAWPVIKSVQTRLRSLTGRDWNITLQAKDKVSGFLKGLVNKLTSPLALLGAGTGLGAGIFFPLKLAGEMEQAGIAMEFFTESAAKGQKFLKELQTFAAKTPFEFPDVRDAAVGLMPIYKQMYGVDEAMKQTMRTIAAFGDAAGLTGAGIQGMNLALLGFRQIGTIGKLSMEELRQVTENLMIPMNIILDELGLTGDALDNLAKEGIEAKRAMEAIVRALKKNFAGGMEKMSKSLLGLTATVKDTASLTVWHFGAGMAEPVRRILLDVVGLTDETGGKFEEFQKRLERAGERVGRKFEEMYRGAKQFFRELTATPGWNQMTWSEKVTLALDMILETITAWLKGPGGEAIKTAGGILGSLLAAGLEGAIPNIVPVAVTLGAAIAKGILQGFKEMLASSPLGSIIAGVLGGAAIGSVVPVIGTGVGAGIGGISGFLSWLLSRPFQTESDIQPYNSGYQQDQWTYLANQRLYPENPSHAAFKQIEYTAHAVGGILTRPHYGLVAEAGPEAIIPLSTRMRARALALYEETGRHLGVRPYAAGGLVGTMTEGWREKIPVSSVPSLALPGPATINLNFDLTGLVRQVVIESREDIDGAVDRITDTIANNLRAVFQNMTK
jgi:tape measure domain-containing protein